LTLRIDAFSLISIIQDINYQKAEELLNRIYLKHKWDSKKRIFSLALFVILLIVILFATISASDFNFAILFSSQLSFLVLLSSILIVINFIIPVINIYLVFRYKKLINSLSYTNNTDGSLDIKPPPHS